VGDIWIVEGFGLSGVFDSTYSESGNTEKPEVSGTSFHQKQRKLGVMSFYFESNASRAAEYPLLVFVRPQVSVVSRTSESFTA